MRIFPVEDELSNSRTCLTMEMKQNQVLRGISREKICRLGLAHLFLELLEILVSTEIRVLMKNQANGAGRVRELIDERFHSYQDWVQSKSGDVDWIKKLRYNETIVSRMCLSRFR